jgi:hypothetical protein
VDTTHRAPVDRYGDSRAGFDTIGADALDELLAELHRRWSRAMDAGDDAQIGRLVAASRALRPALIALSAEAAIGAGHRGADALRDPAAVTAG